MDRQHKNTLAGHFSSHHQIAMLSGPRQVGKTTLARTIRGEQDTCYFNWDDFDDRELLLRGAKAMARHIDLVLAWWP